MVDSVIFIRNCLHFRISKLFNHSELDAVKDRKDKFKRYWCAVGECGLVCHGMLCCFMVWYGRCGVVCYCMV